MIRTLLAAFLSVIAAFTSTARTQEPKIQVVTSFSILSDLVKEIGKHRVQVTALVGPNSDAHVFEPTTASAETLTRGDLLILNGFGFEGWMARLIDSCGFKGPVITATEGVKPLLAMESGLASDPHAWHDVQNTKIYARNIAKALMVKDPSYLPFYEKNLNAYLEKLDGLDLWIRNQFSEIPPQKRKIITAHDGFRYFARAYGIQVLAPMGISTEAEPSAKALGDLILQIRKENIKAVFVENIANTQMVEQIVAETGTEIGGTLYSDALSELEGPAPTYLKMMRHNVQTLKHALLKN